MTIVTRRQMLASVAGGIAATAIPAFGQGTVQPPPGPFTLPRLPYAFNALEAAIDARTMEIHHGRHHQAYVTGLNTAVMGNAELSRRSLDQILRNINQVPEAIRQAVINHGGGHYNHTLFWEIMAPNAGGNPAGMLAEAINSTFTNFDTFKTQFRTAALSRFGSGWAWLVYANNRLQISHTANQDCPLMTGAVPLLGLDVWEHAYYLRYQNRRADYIDGWWSVVNWPAVATRFNQARQG